MYVFKSLGTHEHIGGTYYLRPIALAELKYVGSRSTVTVSRVRYVTRKYTMIASNHVTRDERDPFGRLSNPRFTNEPVRNVTGTDSYVCDRTGVALLSTENTGRSFPT